MVFFSHRATPEEKESRGRKNESWNKYSGLQKKEGAYPGKPGGYDGRISSDYFKMGV